MRLFWFKTRLPVLGTTDFMDDPNRHEIALCIGREYRDRPATRLRASLGFDRGIEFAEYRHGFTFICVCSKSLHGVYIQA